MNWDLKPWSEVLEIKNGKNQSKVADENGIYPIYGSGGIMGYANDYLCEAGTTIIGRKGSINNPIFVNKRFWNVDTAFGLVPKKGLDNRYFYYFCSTYNFLKHNKATTLPSLTKTDLLKIQIPLPPLPIQQKIAAVLDKADAIRKRSQQILAKYDQLAQSVFLEMFGDPVKNEKGWEVKPMGDYGTFKNGLNFSKDDSGFELKCLGVGDFKSNYQIKEFHNLSTINISAIPSEEYLLKNGDLVFVRSNGNKNLVGRCVAVYPDSERASFSGFCIRYRINKSDLETVYLTQLFRNSRFKKTMLNGGRGANIQNINQQILSNLKISVPPISLQNQFASIISQIEKQKAQTQLELDRAEDLYQSLLQRAFNGELFPEKELTEA